MADASIFGMIRPQATVRLEDPDEIRAKQLQVRNLMMQQEAGQLGLEQTRRGIEREDAFTRLFSGGRTPTDAEMFSVDPKGATANIKARMDARKTGAEASDKETATLERALKIHHDQLRNVTNPQTAAQWVTAGFNDPMLSPILQRAGSPQEVISRIPQDPQGFENWRMQNGLGLEKFAADLREKEKIKETGRHNLSTEANAAGQLAVSRGNLAETRANNAKPVFDPVRGVFATRPDAKGGSTVIAPQGMPQSPQQIQSLREDTDKLRQEFEAKPSVKNYRDVIPIAAAGRKAPDTRSGDIQMAYAVGKILDPNSVVREGELKLVGDAATVMGKIEGELRTLTQGKGRLTPETRNALNAMLSNAVEQRKASYEAEKGSYGGIVQRRGYKPEDVFIDVPEDRRAPVTPPAAAGWKVTPVK